MASEVSSVRCFAGWQKVFKHHSEVLNCEMTFGVYVPDVQTDNEKLPAVMYLSGLTCTHANVMEKAGFQQHASRLRLIVIHPDTSPRGVDIEGDSDSWDFGKGAGFYVDSTAAPWSSHYKMYSYVTDELPKLVAGVVPVDADRMGVFGHSMGGHGAIVAGLRLPEVFKSISAFAPIAHPINCPWGQKAFSNYLGSDESAWKAYDASLLAERYDGPARVVLVDQGTKDSFLSAGQLQPENLKGNANVSFEVRMREHYDHGYYFIQTFIGEHLEHHAKYL